jgi:DNA-binding FrmR family transcriptional regulator
MALSMQQVAARVQALRYRNSERDARNLDVLAVRKGKISEVYPDFFPDGVDANVVANFIDIVARDLSEVMAPLPAVNCSAANQVNDRARNFADKRTRIASNYFQHSDLAVHMYSGADWYLTYGFVPFIIELDEEAKLPRIRVENPVGAYPEFDRYGRCVAFAKRYMMSLGELVSQFPEYERELLGGLGYKQDLNHQVEMIRYYDADQSIIYIPSKDNLVLSLAKNPIGKMMVIIARKPSIDGELRGQFDDVLGIQLLRNRFALLAMEAAEKSVQAPIVLPNDVQELQLGGDAVIRTANPQGVRRVELTLPTGAFTEQNLLNQELRVGARYPESRTGNVNASIVTGQGVQALMGAFDTQVKSAQAIFAAALRDVITLCFCVDEMIFPEEKTIRGVDSGSPYEITYKPSKDIKGDYSADVRYGMLAGLNPAQGLIFMLQALGGGLISKDMAMRELPFTVNVTQELEKIEIENMRAGLLSALTASAQAIPQMVAQGQDASEIVRNIAAVIKARQKGQMLEDAIEATFTPQQQVPPAGAPSSMVEQPSPAPEGVPAGGAPSPQGGVNLPPAQGPRPDVQSILSSLTGSGGANSSVRTIQRQ